MNWFTTKVAEGATLGVLLERLDEQVQEALRTGCLDADAQVYIVVLKDGVQLFVNESARSGLPVIASLALLPCPPPRAGERERALLARESDGA